MGYETDVQRVQSILSTCETRRLDTFMTIIQHKPDLGFLLEAKGKEP
jgi:hypothetical protein